MSSPLRSPRITRLIPVAFYLFLFIFLVLYLRSIDFSKLKDIELNWWFLLLASFLALGKNYLGAFTWLVILRSLGAKEVRMQPSLIYVYAKAWLGRYIPGTAPWILGKIYFASQHNISKQKLAVSSILEGGLQVVTLLVFSLVLLIFDRRLDVIGSGLKLAMILVASAGVVVLMPGIFNWFIRFAYKKFRRRELELEHQATPQTIMRGATLYLIDAIINGLSLFFIAKAVDPSLTYHNLAFVVGAGCLAGAVSMLAFFAPSGLGVREGIQLVLFSLIMPKEMALAVTIITRLWTVGVDFIFFGISRLFAGDAVTASPTDARKEPSA